MNQVKTSDVHPMPNIKKTALLGNRRKLRKITFMFPNQGTKPVDGGAEMQTTKLTDKEKVSTKKNDSMSNISCDIIEHI